uniref:Fanconi anemia group J protein homolog n=1 Tax=Styela clava TaxID=7725 RepID=UPI00193A4408|nr:Fanconi anemia group J protein homolog [Styela clava]
MEDTKFSATSAVSLKIGGITVKFPAQPYPSQLSMMSMIIKGLEKRQHCLLESPTGSGKSLALLCSALAWQQTQYEKSENEFLSKLTSDVENQNPICTCDELNGKSKPESSVGTSSSNYFNATTGSDVIDLCTPENDDCDDDFKKKVKAKSKAKTILCPACRELKEKSKCCQSEEKEIDDTDFKKPRVPKIWFGTRTHKQIAQITKELGRTSYDSTNMTILSSRQHSCIHPAVMKSSNKNEECRDLRMGKHTLGAKCAFYQNVHRMKSHYQLGCAGLGAAWDLEDLVGLGKTIKACPYYSAKELVSSSNIIFCPYNYLIDPMIRSQMQINLKNQIIILDEAHNIEDSAREAGSFTMTEAALANTTTDLDCLMNEGIKVDDHRPLHLLCTRLGQWITEHARNLSPSDYETATQVWYGRDIIRHLNDWGITQDTLPLLEGNFAVATDLGEEDIETAKILHSSSQATLGGLFNVLRYLMTQEHKYCDDYRITIIRQMVFGPVPPKRTRDGWVTLNKRSKKHSVTNLHFWCLNPAVAFNDFSGAHSIILTSGTLSPMSSFSSELGLSFPIQLEANHVIKDSQVWVGSIGRGPKGIQLEATYKNTDKFEFQDELGNLICSVCRAVPHGVLCFVSSYNMLKKLQERWQTTRLWDRIEETKQIVCEPRSSSKDEFDSLLQSFYDAVKKSEEENQFGGALLIAVCRGKVSEGLDFADNNARAVITVGIPFPSIKDKQVELKRKYNDMHKNHRGLLAGSQWYEIQAFRAMNQALGRCIRHKTDWGALIIVDDRFCKNPKKYSKGLSKWVRQKMIPYTSFDNAMSNITAFVQRQMSGTSNVSLPTVNVNSSPPITSSSTARSILSSIHESLHVEKVEPESMDVSLNRSIDKSSTKKKKKPTKQKVVTKTTENILHHENDEIDSSPNDDFQNESFDKFNRTSVRKKTKAKPPSKMNCSKIMENNSSDGTTNRKINENEISGLETLANIKPTNNCEKFHQQIPVKRESKTNLSNSSKKTILKLSSDTTLPIPSTLDVIDSLNDDVMVDDLFDCTIPATPEKMNITVIPESPPSANGDSIHIGFQRALDFDSGISSARKRKLTQSHTGISTPNSKRTDKEDFDTLSNCEQNSGDLLSRATRKQCLKKEKGTHISEKKSVLKCKACTVILYERVQQTIACERLQSSFINENFLGQKSIMCDVYSVESKQMDFEFITLIKEKSRDDSSIELNSIWCEEDHRCYQIYRCQCCMKPVAFRIVSEQQFRDKYFFISQLVERIDD